MAAKIPVTVITGFLGAGKTSLVADILRQNQRNTNPRRFALIINEFGECGIDRALLEGGGKQSENNSENTCQAAAIEELANGCICCKVADDFIPTLEKILSLTPPIDHIIIETSGLALPKPLITAFNWPDIAPRVTVDGVIALVDAERLASGLFDEPPPDAPPDSPDHENPSWEVFIDQISAADVIILNKIELLPEAKITELTTLLRRQTRPGVAPGVAIVTATHAKLPLALTLGLQAEAENDLNSRPSLHDSLPDHNHEDFASVVVRFGTVTQNPPDFAKKLAKWAEERQILRLKGFIAVADKNRRLVIQAVGGRIEQYYDRPWGEHEPRASILVAIGLNSLNPTEITESLMKVT